jgi:hypothetical protein
MPKCYLCGAETQLHSYGVPVCLKCLEIQELPIKRGVAERFMTDLLPLEGINDHSLKPR